MSEYKIDSHFWNKYIFLSLAIITLLACRMPGTTPSKPEEPIHVPPTATVEVASPVPPTPTFEPPAGFMEYQDTAAGISIYIPIDWITTEVIKGQYAIFQSYPVDKYVGGEGFQPGDSKCDFNLDLDAGSPEEILAQWTSDGLSTILSREDVTLDSGLAGLRVELEGWGGSLTMFTMNDNQVIALTCYGEREYFDEIALTIRPLD